MVKALIVYGTRYGATEMTSEEIADVFRQEGLDVKVVNLKNDKVKDIAEYELVTVGSGIQINKLSSEIIHLRFHCSTNRTKRKPCE